ncbi:MAG: hypothetical protein ACOC1I_00100 [Spirochaetota bacterium]
MTDAWKKLLGISVICHAVAFGAILLVSIFSFTTRIVLAEFQIEWIFARTWAEFLSLMPVFQAWATLLVFGWIVPMKASGRAQSSFDRFGGSIALLLVLTLIFAVSYLVGYPAAASRVEELEFTSTLASRLRASALEARADQNYTRALSELNQYLVLVGESEEAQELLIDIRDEARADEVRLDVTAETEQPSLAEGARADQLIDRASAAVQREDYSTAHYMATLAQALEPENREAALLAARALQELERLAPDQEESEAFDLFGRKQAAKAALTRQDYVDAYYRFLSLANDYPRDVDVRRYLETAREQVASLAVFRDEIESALALPGMPDVAFVNASGPGRTELMVIGKLVRTGTGVYAQQLELLEIAADGTTLRHVSSDYGKLADSYFMLTVIDRDSSSAIERPTIHAGSPGAVTEGILELGPAPDELWLIASVSRSPSTASISALSRTIATLDQYGLLSEPVELEFLLRLVTPFAFLILSLVVLGFSWRFRSRYLHLPPIPTLVLVPVAPFFILPAYLLLRFAERILVSAVLLSGGIAVSIVLVVALQALLLLVSLGYVALGSRE